MARLLTPRSVAVIGASRNPANVSHQVVRNLLAGGCGAEAQSELRDLARPSGMRLIGPTYIGIANTDVGLNANFSPYAPRPGRIAMLSQSGAPGIAIVERSTRMGLGVSSFASVGNRADVSGNDLLQYWARTPRLREFINPNRAVANPVDLVASATPAIYEQAVRLVLADEAIDAAIAICAHTFAAPPASVAEVLPRAASGVTKPVVGCFLAAPERPPLIPGRGQGADIPAFPSPEPAARALARAATYGEWRRRPPGAVPALRRFDIDRAHAVLDRVAEGPEDGSWLQADQVDELLGAEGVPFLRSAPVRSVEEAQRVAGEGLQDPGHLRTGEVAHLGRSPGTARRHPSPGG